METELCSSVPSQHPHHAAPTPAVTLLRIHHPLHVGNRGQPVAQADLELARVSAAAGHHEGACFACHQAVEKALKGLHLRHGQQAWGHGLGRSWRDLPPAVSAALAASISDLEDRLRILDALYIPTRYPDSLPDGAPTDHFGRLQSEDALRHARSIVDAIAAALA